MAQNLFEKYGIKEVADVTLYRIERKDETFESQRKISISSILKGALTKEVVFPLDEDGKGSADGYEAYVFKDADVLTHFNYDCDDVIEVKGSSLFIDNADPAIVSGTYTAGQKVPSDSADYTAIVNYLTTGTPANIFGATNVALLSLLEKNSNRSLRDRLAELLAKGYSITAGSLEVSTIKSRGIVGGAASQDAGLASKDYITMKSTAVTPLTLDNITLQAFEAAITENGGEYVEEDGVITSAYITFVVPVDATPEEIMGAFQVQQKRLYDDLGIIVRFTQPVRTGDVTITTFTGTVTVNVTVDPSVEAGDEVTGNIVFTFTESVLDSATETIINAAKGGTLTAAQINALFDLAETDETVKVAVAEGLATVVTDSVPVNTVVNSVIVNEENDEYQSFLITFTATLASSDEASTGIFEIKTDTPGHWAMDVDRTVGTHEFSYPE